jgi:hypothetical protein
MIADEQIMLEWQLEIELQEQEELDFAPFTDEGRCRFCGVTYACLGRHKIVCLKNPNRLKFYRGECEEEGETYYWRHRAEISFHHRDYYQRPDVKEKMRKYMREYMRRRHPTLTCVDCGAPMPYAKKNRCHKCRLGATSRGEDPDSNLPLWNKFRMIERDLPTPADNGSSGGSAVRDPSASLEDSFRDSGQVGSKGARQ